MSVQQLHAQKFQCIEESKQLYNDDLIKNIIASCKDFWGLDIPNDIKHRIMYVDIHLSKDTNILILDDSYVSNGLLLKRPDALVQIGENLALIYSKNYKLANDSIWLKHVYNMCKKTTYETSFEIISWERNIYKDINYKNPEIKSDSYDVPEFYTRYGPNKYLILKNKLISKSISDEVIHKYNFFPKNIDSPWKWEDMRYRKGLMDFVETDSIK